MDEHRIAALEATLEELRRARVAADNRIAALEREVRRLDEDDLDRRTQEELRQVDQELRLAFEEEKVKRLKRRGDALVLRAMSEKNGVSRSKDPNALARVLAEARRAEERRERGGGVAGPDGEHILGAIRPGVSRYGECDPNQPGQQDR
jgi:hypothetical protein